MGKVLDFENRSPASLQGYAAKKLLEKQGKQIHWVSLDDSLPPEDRRQYYLLAIEFVGGTQSISSSRRLYGQWIDYRDSGFTQVTHWAPMPNLPETKIYKSEVPRD